MVESPNYSGWKGAAVTLTLLASVLAMIAFMSNAWAVPAEKEYDHRFEGLGLWKYCFQMDDGASECQDTVNLDTPGWYTATQGIMAAAFILIFASLVIIVISECFQKCRPNVWLIVVYIITNIISVVLQATGVGIFGADIESYVVYNDNSEEIRLKVSWSFISAVIACGVQLFAGLCAICEVISKHQWGAAPGIEIYQTTNPSEELIGQTYPPVVKCKCPGTWGVFYQES